MGLKGPLDVGNPHQNNQCIPDCAIHLISAPMFDENCNPCGNPADCWGPLFLMIVSLSFFNDLKKHLNAGQSADGCAQKFQAITP